MTGSRDSDEVDRGSNELNITANAKQHRESAHLFPRNPSGSPTSDYARAVTFRFGQTVDCYRRDGRAMSRLCQKSDRERVQFWRGDDAEKVRADQEREPAREMMITGHSMNALDRKIALIKGDLRVSEKNV